MLINTYLTLFQIHQMADSALLSYEMTCSWKRAHEAAVEFAADEFGVRATVSQASTAVRLAQTGWEGISISVKAAINS
tara:strand:+ start:1061 stop:1294 length:234 start_codon:yes stop_codon:yes gene_type:complete